MKKQKLTKTVVDKIPFTNAKQAIIRDTELTGFGVRVGQTAKTYFVEKRVGSRNVRSTIGRHGQITCEQARKLAQEKLGKMAIGQNPNEERRIAKARAVTLRQALEEYLAPSRTLKPRTASRYRQLVERVFADWLERPLVDISKDMVAKRHARLGQDNGPALANQAMRVLRAIFNFSLARYEDRDGEPVLHTNPVNRISTTRSWFRVDRRQTMIPRAHLGDWINAVYCLPKGARTKRELAARETSRDYLLLVLFTGLRRNEAANLRWQDIDLKARTLTIKETKNGDPLTLPLSHYVFDILARRKANSGLGYVFPNSRGSGPLVDIRKQLARVSLESGLSITIHDLRRTFTTIAEGLDISAYALKRLLNHRCDADVTAGYIIHDIERLRGPMQRIADTILSAVHVRRIRIDGK